MKFLGSSPLESPALNCFGYVPARILPLKIPCICIFYKCFNKLKCTDVHIYYFLGFWVGARKPTFQVRFTAPLK